MVYYIYAGSFFSYQITSFGTHNPPVSLSNENGLVVIYLSDRQYYQRFTVNAYANGMSEQSSWFQGWGVADETLNGSNMVLVPYATKLAGNVTISGNVGIGTTYTKGYTFAVNGTAIATAITVKAYPNWPDYVFKKGYKLPSLTDIKVYLDKNHHLPEVPSEQEVVQNGINLGEMVKLQTKKIEELTLYLIEQQRSMNPYRNKSIS